MRRGLERADQRDRQRHGLSLQRQFRLSRQSSLSQRRSEFGKSTSYRGFTTTAHRGNNPLRTPPNFNTFFERETPRRGHWSVGWGFALNNSGIGTTAR